MSWPAPCWDPADAVAMINYEAGSPDDSHDLDRGDHVFEAIHTPPSVREVTVAEFRENKQGRASNQSEVLEALNERKPFLFVAGVPGTGKSHLVRWLHMNRAHEDPQELRRYVPRRMTRLRDVLRTVLEYADETVRDQLERDLESATTGLDEETARLQFLANLALVIESRADAIKRGEDPRFQLLDHVQVVDELHELLRAKPVREYLCRDGGSIARMVASRLTGERGEGVSADEEMRISDEDLGGIAGLDLRDVAKEAERLHSRISTNPHQRDAVLSLLGPAHSDPALQRLVGIGTGKLQEAMTDLLDSLQQSGKRLVLFFEDWGQISGFQEELAEAIAAASENAALAVVAITTDRLQEQRGNVLDRGRIFVLDPPVSAVPGAELERAHPGAAELTGHALNAIRWGREALREKYEERPSHEGWLASKCETDCPFDIQDRCLATFGSTHIDGVGEVGYFPFTRTSLKNALNRKAAGSAAVPRLVLHEVVRKAIGPKYAKDLADGDFPSPSFAAEFRPEPLTLTGVQATTIEKNLAELGESDEQDRVRAFVETYRRDLALESFDDGVRVALGLPKFLETPPPGPPPTPGPGDPPPEPDVAIPSLAKEAFEWARGGTVTADRMLRELAAREVLAGLPVYEPIWRRSEWARIGIDHTHVALGSEEKHSKGGPEIRIAKEEADALAYLAWSFDRPMGWREVEGVRVARVVTEVALDRWISSVSDQLFDDIDSRAIAVEALMRVLAISGIAAGLAAELTTENVLDVVFGQPTEPAMSALDKVARGDRAGTLDVLLRYVGFAQGEGDVTAIDYDFVAPLAERIVADPTLPVSDELPTGTPDWARSLGEELNQVVDDEFEQFQEWWSQYGHSLSSREDVVNLIGELRMLQNRALSAKQPGTQVALLRSRDQEAVNAVSNAIDRVEATINTQERDPFEELAKSNDLLDTGSDTVITSRSVVARGLQSLAQFRAQLKTLYLNTLALVEIVEKQLPEQAEEEALDTFALDEAIELAKTASAQLSS